MAAFKQQGFDGLILRERKDKGFRQFHFRGLKKVSGEWQVIYTGHNLLKLFGAWKNGLVAAELLA